MLRMFKKVSKVKQMLGALLVLGLLSWVGIEGALVGGLVIYGMYKLTKKLGIKSRLRSLVTKKNLFRLALGGFALYVIDTFGFENVMSVTIGAVGYYTYKKYDVKVKISKLKQLVLN
ncbi:MULTISPECIES: hypothetical protein [Bacillus]|uniref:Uncharacterized protein n=2 Tax=Bacillus thuringiensis TaxID=1428 RepID=A0AAP4Q8S4_BACTU|nr:MULTISPECIES: hypothetical protein [Bacillus]HDR7922659.1 hypothetical protein [Bacillus paranthracis]AFV21974.1 hypothetical protein BTB_502p06690 [Bacillus thuringiensis Bt407]ERI00848.1 hypothetical protein BTCBT_002403 [Bacillus thuringiensis T01-328]MBN6707624.1 hypothetical protein [Bacillus thuringiensis]MDF9599456.1 hypothetical protein [Bacillus cereus]